MNIKYFAPFAALGTTGHSVLRVFAYQYGKNQSSVSISAYTETDYSNDWISNMYTSETIMNGSSLSVVINPEEDLKNKDYKVLYLFYDNILTGEKDLLAAVIDISADNLSNSKNYIDLPNIFTCQLDLQGSDYIQHLQSRTIKGISFKGSKRASSFLNKRSYEANIIDRQSNNVPYLDDTTLTNYGFKIT